MRKLVNDKLRLLIALAVVLILGLMGSSAAFAQFSGAIEGTVTDNSGAIVPDAKVVLTNEATGVSSSGVSNSAGVFHFPALGTGLYKVTASVPGFASVRCSISS